jgi:hypothetical protein
MVSILFVVLYGITEISVPKQGEGIMGKHAHIETPDQPLCLALPHIRKHCRGIVRVLIRFAGNFPILKKPRG